MRGVRGLSADRRAEPGLGACPLMTEAAGNHVHLHLRMKTSLGPGTLRGSRAPGESGTMSAPGGGRGRSLTPAPPAPSCCPQRAACPFSPLEDLALLGCRSRQECEWVLLLSPAPGHLDHPLKAPTEPTGWDPQERPPGAQRPCPGPGQPSLHLLTPWPALPPSDSTCAFVS